MAECLGSLRHRQIEFKAGTLINPAGNSNAASMQIKNAFNNRKTQSGR